MGKRQHSTHQYISPTPRFLLDKSQNVSLDREKAERMCKKKLKKISNVKSKLYLTVLVRNTLKHVQNCDYVTFTFDDDILVNMNLFRRFGARIFLPMILMIY